MSSNFRIAFPSYLLPSHPPSLILVPAPSSPLHLSSRFVTTSRLPFALSRLAVSTILHLSFLSSMDRTSSTPLPNVVLSPPLSSTPPSYHLTPPSPLGEPISFPYPLHYSSQSSLTSLPSTYHIISVTKLLLSSLSSPSTPLHTTLLFFPPSILYLFPFSFLLLSTPLSPYPLQYLLGPSHIQFFQPSFILLLPPPEPLLSSSSFSNFPSSGSSALRAVPLSLSCFFSSTLFLALTRASPCLSPPSLRSLYCSASTFSDDDFLLTSAFSPPSEQLPSTDPVLETVGGAIARAIRAA